MRLEDDPASFWGVKRPIFRGELAVRFKAFFPDSVAVPEDQGHVAMDLNLQVESGKKNRTEAINLTDYSDENKVGVTGKMLGILYIY